MLSRWVVLAVVLTSSLCLNGADAVKQPAADPATPLPNVEAIDVQYSSNEPVPPDVRDKVVSIITLKMGEPVALWKMRESLRALAASRLFANESLKAEPENGHLRLIVFLQPCPIVTKINFVNATPAQVASLTPLLGVKEKSGVLASQIFEDAVRLTQELRKTNAGASVTGELKPTNTAETEAEVTFTLVSK